MNDERIMVQTAGHRYPVVMGNAAATLAELWEKRWHRGAIIGDSRTAGLFSATLRRSLEAKGVNTLELSFPEGESAKNRRTKEALEDSLLDAGFDREDCIIAVGGGIALDVAGFVAATYLRGIAHINIATSLLAQVDAAIGGKTGVNTTQGKNLIGAFHQPRAVIIDRESLKSLPKYEVKNGLAEAVKHAVIADQTLFDDLETWITESSDLILSAELLSRCIEIKAQVVAADERETAYRQILNFGHTVAHALEIASDHRMSHGQAVAVGMVIEARVAQVICGFPADHVGRLISILSCIGLPTTASVSCDNALQAMRLDKKNRQGKIFCALPKRIGAMHEADGHWACAVSDAQLREAWL